MSSDMRHFHAGFVKALGAATATTLVSLVAWLLCILFGVIPADKKQAETLLIFLIVGLSLWLGATVCFRYLSHRRSQQKIQELERHLSRANFLIRFQELIYGRKKDDT